jgi:hypothetical protein
MAERVIVARDRWGNIEAYREGKHFYEWSNFCAAYVCRYCRDHADKAYCFCGWRMTRDRLAEMETD